MRPPPDSYLDGCTCFFDRFGKVSHVDVCNEHDGDWWYKRTALEKIGADWRFSVRLARRHLTNTPWQPVALLSAVGALALFWSPIGWVMWWAK